MQIEILKVEQSQNGKYPMVTVSFSGQNGVAAKKIMSFSPVFKTFAEAQTGDVYEVESVKDDKGFYQWTSAKPLGKGSGPTPSANSTGNTQMTRTSTFETPEERAKKQVYIVKQSSIAAAIALATATKKSLSAQEIIEVAQEFVDYVFDDYKDSDLVEEVEVN